MKTIEYYMNLPYRLELVPDTDEGGFVASYPELRGCLTSGETAEAALKNALDCKREWLTAALECMDFFSRLGVTIYICLIFRYMKNHFNGNKLFGYDLLCFFEIRILCHNFGRRQMYSLSCFLLFPSMMGVPWLRSGFSSSAFTIVGYFSTVS